VGSTTSTGHSASPSLHQPGSETGRAKMSPRHRLKPHEGWPGVCCFGSGWFCPRSPLQKSGPEDFSCISHLAAAAGAAQGTRGQLPPVRACGDARGMSVIWYLSVSFDFICLPRAQALEPKEEISVQVRT